MDRVLSAVLFGLFLCTVWSCRSANDSEKLAEIDGTVITRAEIDRAAGKQLQNLRQQLYHLEQQKLDEYVGATLLTREAKEQAVSVTTLLDREVNIKVKPVSEDEIRTFYNQNKDRLPAELDKLHDQISEYLHQQRVADRKNEYIKTLRTKAKITTYLKPPPIQRANVLIKDAPFRGETTAPVTLIKFEDFECPFCRSVQPTLEELLKKYAGKVRIFHKDLPLEQLHRNAQLAAEAARCAGDQGRFWQYHDTLYHNAPKLSPVELKAYAKEMKLDTAAFDQCLASGKHKSAVQQDLNEGAKLGLTGTPTFFINGHEMSGALPLEAFSTVIDEELAQIR
jgi:protein-disulfide isomerase